MLRRLLRSLPVIAAVLLVAPSRAARAQNELFVTNAGSQSITVFSRTAGGNVAPLRTISGGATGLQNPQGVAVDTVHDEILVANSVGHSITVYSRTASGNAAPLRTISGANTGMSNPRGLALDVANDEILVTNPGNNSVTAYSRTANGNVSPLRTLKGGMTGMNGPQGLALDLVHDEIAVVNKNTSFSIFSVTVYSRTASGNVTPLRTIMGANSGLDQPFAAAVDPIHDELFVTNGVFPAAEKVTVHSRTADGNTPPLRTIVGASTGLSAPEGVVLDLVNDELGVANAGNLSIRFYPR